MHVCVHVCMSTYTYVHICVYLCLSVPAYITSIVKTGRASCSISRCCGGELVPWGSGVCVTSSQEVACFNFYQEINPGGAHPKLINTISIYSIEKHIS